MHNMQRWETFQVVSTLTTASNDQLLLRLSDFLPATRAIRRTVIGACRFCHFPVDQHHYPIKMFDGSRGNFAWIKAQSSCITPCMPVLAK